ncbi:iron complex transport system ATP-binding protein [Sinobaca qinghaiensis]|uniref:Iron complex transport system ATP-binding protein n=1 Tax=Sinobaca qinghaiensis TaxID=342944 RepID=A0A419UWD4_9BACL|nr:ATP-binding cassette domain-containing protein [Sinobaca qinghaiensis]RKD69444.1 iron complex transport system ATP-binding protein [Sinobaca qinghaiensis]
MPEPLFQLQNVSVRTGGQSRLQNINLSLEDGIHTGLLGLNGSGKTTILQLLTGYVWPTEGTVHSWMGQHGRVSMQTLRREIGWVSDALDDRYRARSSDTALEVVISGYFASVGLYEEPADEVTAYARKCLELFQVGAYAEKPYSRLSQGEKRRVMLARAWVIRPRLLILDEPCTGLDVKGREELLSILERALSEPGAPTLLYVTHHIEELPPAIVNMALLKNGQMLEHGFKKEVLSNDLISEAFDVQASISWEEERPWLRIKNKMKNH